MNDNTSLPVVHTFTEGDTLDDLDLNFPDPGNANANIVLTGFTVKLRWKGLYLLATGAAIVGTVPSSTTARFDCGAIIAAGPDTYWCQAELTDTAGKIQATDDFAIVVKSKVA